MQDTLGALLAVGLVYVVVRFAFGSSSGSSSAGSGGGGAGVPGGASVAPQAGAQRGAAQRRNMAGVSDEMVSGSARRCENSARRGKRGGGSSASLASLAPAERRCHSHLASQPTQLLSGN
jgi:hypothetical protein